MLIISNIMFICIALLFLSVSLRCLFYKPKCLQSAVIFMIIAGLMLGPVFFKTELRHQEPLKMFYNDNVLVVLDSNMIEYSDSSYTNGEVCFDVYTAKTIYGVFDRTRKVLNTRCQ